VLVRVLIVLISCKKRFSLAYLSPIYFTARLFASISPAGPTSIDSIPHLELLKKVTAGGGIPPEEHFSGRIYLKSSSRGSSRNSVHMTMSFVLSCDGLLSALKSYKLLAKRSTI
jgi:hypothetical protein